MQSLLAAVGLDRTWNSQTASSLGEVWIDRGAVSEVRELLPDISAVAAATESCILELQEEARRLETASLPDALVVLRRWSQNLRKRPRADEDLASFRAQFMRSNALETSLEALRHNTVLRRALHGALAVSEALDATLVASSEGAPVGLARPISSLEHGPPGVAAEICSTLQLCLPKAAAPLVRPTLCAVFGSTPQECASAGVRLVAKLKEEWTDVVRSQAARSLERKLDSLTYELQKTPTASSLTPKIDNPFLFGSPDRNASEDHDSERASLARRRASHEAVIVLTALCDVVMTALRQAEHRGQTTNLALSELGSSMEVWTKSRDAPVSPQANGRRGGHGPSSAECDIALAAFSTNTSSGMARGLALLQLPRSPLHFVPGVSLHVRDIEVLGSLNAMTERWVEEDLDGFHTILQQLRLMLAGPDDVMCESGMDIVEKGIAASGLRNGIVDIDDHRGGVPHCRGDSSSRLDVPMDEKTQTRPALLARRVEVMAERNQLLARLQDLDGELGLLDDLLLQSSCSSSRVPSSTPSDKTISASDCSEAHTNSCKSSSCTTASNSRLLETLLPSVAETVALEITGQLQTVSEAVSAESQRYVERLRGQLQQRRSQLLLSVVSHLDSETVHLPFTVPTSSKACATVLRDKNAIEAARNRMKELCYRVEAVLLGVRIIPEVPNVSARCRAKWMDGEHYDAEVQCVMDDGTILLNWLRPCPDLSRQQEGSEAKQLVTVSDRGGDDTLHRIVARADVHLVGRGSVADPPKEVKEAARIFEGRSQEDQLCADCGRERSDWASVSFGIYLCSSCAAVHRELGPRKSLVRPLDSGWGWPLLDLAPLRLGGNAAFQARLEGYAAVTRAAATDRYSSRFAEYYRRYLDALCAGMQPPQSLAQEGSASPFTGDFLTGCEAAAVAHTASQRFLAAAAAALSRAANSTSAQRQRGGLLRAQSAAEASSQRWSSEGRPRASSMWGESSSQIVVGL